LLSYSAHLQIRAQAELELRRRGGREDTSLTPYRLDALGYIREKLGWQPWAGDGDHPGQVEILAAYTDALRAQLTAPGESCRNIIRVEAGHTVGKTFLASGIVNHFFDCFPPAICYTFAPTYEQIHDLLWKEIKATRRGKGLPGRILDLGLHVADNHFAKGRATSNAGGQGTERAQGQHGPYLLFVLDEAEGIADYVYDAVKSMTSGGVSIVLMLANPRTRSSRFHRAAEGDTVANFRISCMYHPNVLSGGEIVPGAVQRRYVEQMIDDGQTQHAEVVDMHDDDSYTFELPWRPGVIYRPDHEFLFRVMGIAPANIADDVFVPTGRYDAAKKRPPAENNPIVARLGVDAARFGKDMGTLYVHHNGRIYRAAQFAQQDSNAYVRAIRTEAIRLAKLGVKDIAFRVDGGGGFGSGVIDGLTADLELRRMFSSYQVLEVHFNATPHDEAAYADLATEIYGHTAEVLHRSALINPPNTLEADLCERKYSWATARSHDIKKDVKKIEPKEDFRKRMHRSPDDGDGCALACAPDRIFKKTRVFSAAAGPARFPAPQQIGGRQR
jgi:hypothetical protein